MTRENLFAGPYLDRRAEARAEADWLDQARADERTVYLAMRGSAALMRAAGSGAGSSPALLLPDDPRVRAVADPDRLLLLGWFREQRCLLLDLPPDFADTQDGETFAELRPLANELPHDEAGLLAYARALTLWRGNHRYCSRCGTATQAQRAGHSRQCPACGYQSFPRIDPAVIVLVHDDDAVLLGRQASWPPNRYSTIAGFVEPGEALEDAVRREVEEETGAKVTTMSYRSSQPWPFPQSLMLGFVARAARHEPVLRDGELEDARWFSRKDIQSGAVLLPPREAISRQLIDHWLGTAG